jgi:undecaprenyl-diphosphatase
VDLWQAIVMGVVQGLGEFLPISSSAHLVILPWLEKFPTPGLTFDVALHFGTLIALLAYFFRDWVQLTGAFFTSLKKKPRHYSPPERMVWFIILGSIPAAVVGLTIEEYAETVLRNPLIVAFNMAFFGILLYIADRLGRKTKKSDEINLLDAILVGLAQALALVPGTSRSGVTITAGLFRGMDRTTAARFSFLLSMPAVAGAAILKANDFFSGVFNWISVVGIMVSGVVGYLAIKYMLYFLRNYSFLVYVLYRMAFAALVFAVWFFRQ